jgi:hypothetical protein
MIDYPSRRSILKGLASLPILSALGPLESAFPAMTATQLSAKTCPTGSCQLNVYFHGLFAFILWPDLTDPSGTKVAGSGCIQAIAPVWSDHENRGGTGEGDPLQANLTYQLQAPRSNSVSANQCFQDRACPIFKGIHLGSPGVVQSNIILPYPNSERSLRCVPKALDIKHHRPIEFFKSPQIVQPLPDRLSLLPVLVYCDLQSPPEVVGLPSWKPQMDGNGIYHLHFRAEPRTEDHFSLGKPYKVFEVLFPGLSLTLNRIYEDAYPCPDANLAEFPAQEQCNLIELVAKSCSNPSIPCKPEMHPRVRPVNCMPIVVDSRYVDVRSIQR